jgi:site-specific recombinase
MKFSLRVSLRPFLHLSIEMWGTQSQQVYAGEVHVIRTVRKLLRSRRLRPQPTFVRAHDDLYKLTENFCEAETASALFGSIWGSSSDRAFVVRLLRWIRMMEQDRELWARFREEWNATLLGLDCVPLFAEAGLPGHHALGPELMRRLAQRLLRRRACGVSRGGR